jgi:hypothetical protein
MIAARGRDHDCSRSDDPSPRATPAAEGHSFNSTRVDGREKGGGPTDRPSIEAGLTDLSRPLA